MVNTFWHFLWIPYIYLLLQFQSQEVEETLKRIQSHKGVVGTIVVNNEGKSFMNYIFFPLIILLFF